MRIAGWASWFDEVDDEDDVVRPGAFLESLKTRRVAMLFNHDVGQPVGRWDLIEEREQGLWAEGEVVDERFSSLVEQGVLFGLSIGFSAETFVDHEQGRDLLKIKLLEISLTAVPMNHRCMITSIELDSEDEQLETTEDHAPAQTAWLGR